MAQRHRLAPSAHLRWRECRVRIRVTHSAALLALALPMALPGVAWSQVAPSGGVHFSIPPAPLDVALGRFGVAARTTVAFTPALTRDVQTQGLSGRYSVEQGLATLLHGTGLQAVPNANGDGFHLQRIPAAVSGVTTLAPVTVSGLADGVITEGTGSYTTPAVTIGKGQQALKEIPQSISVVTRELLDEQNLTSVYDALASTTGITIQQSPQGGRYIYSRGFDLTTVQYDGVPLNRGMYGRANNFNAGTAIYDRVEVLRGAAGLLQGEGNPSGAVNLVRKRPMDASALTMEVRGGSWDRYGALIDASGVLNEAGTLRGRGVVDYEDQHSFIDYVNRRNATYYGTLEYDLSAATTVNVGMSSETIKGRPTMNGLPRLTNGDDLFLPRSTYLGATWNRQDTSNRGIFADLTHRFNDNWALKVAAVHFNEDHDLKYASSNRAVNPLMRQGAVMAARSIADIETSGIDAYLTGNVELFGRRHEIVSGMNYSRATNDTTYGFKTNYNVFDIDHYNANIREPDDAEIYASTREARRGDSRQFGIYNAARLQIADPLKLIVGARVSWFETDWKTNTTGLSPSTGTTKSTENGVVNPYAGLIYDLTPQWSAYVSYADIFKPQSEQNEAGALLKPITGTNYEAGVKGELLDGRLNASFAAFRINQKNRAQADFNTSPTCRADYYCYTDSGEVRSQGFDAEISGKVAPGWNVFAGYTFNQTKYVKDVSSEGMSFNTYTPKHIFRLWSTYQLPGDLQDFTVGGGVNAQSASYREVSGQRANMGGRSVWNAYAKYQINRNWATTLNVNNVFDKKYYSSLANLVAGNFYGDPRNVMVTLRGTF